jgi:anti-sigma factor RsiW
MTSDACRELRASLGAAAIGKIDPGEEIALRAHLDGCAECRAELHDLAAVARALDRADISVVQSQPEPADDLGLRVRERVAEERRDGRRRSRRRRATVGATALAAVAAAVLAFVLVFSSSGHAGTRVIFPESKGVSARATLHPRPAGIEVAFHVSGLDDAEYYWVWVTGDDGDRISAGTFQGEANPVDLTMSVAIPMKDARRIWVTDAHDNVVLDSPVAPGKK